jgi:hypothetical protein
MDVFMSQVQDLDFLGDCFVQQILFHLLSTLGIHVFLLVIAFVYFLN